MLTFLASHNDGGDYNKIYIKIFCNLFEEIVPQLK
jgi:hypothetical protein